MVVPLLALDTTVPAGPQISLPILKKCTFKFRTLWDGCIYLADMPVLPGHRRTGTGECRGGAGWQVASEAMGVAGETIEAAQGNSNLAGSD